jgi:predicted SprT family Zn-dependent metalloprotease
VNVLFPVEASDDEALLQRLYDRLRARFGFGEASVRLSSRKLTGGEIRYGKPHRITISAHLSPSERRHTLLHEAAHAWAHRLQGVSAGHGRVFRALAKRLGAKDGEAPMTPALAKFRESRQVIYRCSGCRRVFRRFRPFRGRRYCLACDRAGRPSLLRRTV